MVEILRRIASGRGREADLELIKLLGRIASNANCFHGQGAPTSVMTMLRWFEDELMEHVVRKRCPAKRCAGLVRYEVLHQSDRLPLAEAICPTGAVVKDERGRVPHRPGEVREVRRLPGAGAVRDRRGRRIWC